MFLDRHDGQVRQYLLVHYCLWQITAFGTVELGLSCFQSKDDTLSRLHQSQITVEEENRIRCTQMQVRETVLTFCMRRAAFSSDLGPGALQVACNVSLVCNWR